MLNYCVKLPNHLVNNCQNHFISCEILKCVTDTIGTSNFKLPVLHVSRGLIVHRNWIRKSREYIRIPYTTYIYILLYTSYFLAHFWKTRPTVTVNNLQESSVHSTTILIFNLFVQPSPSSEFFFLTNSWP